MFILICLYVFTYLLQIVKIILVVRRNKMNTNSTPFKKRENPLVKITKQVESADREKYTATMDKNLRRRIKIASAMKDMQLSTFIEEACREKLEREEL